MRSKVNNKVEIYKTADNQTQVNVKFEDETVWLNQTQLAKLFSHSKQNISLHINNCFKEGELEKKGTVKESLTVQTEGNRKVKRNIEYYNLDVIISVGYRVKSKRGTQFRIWATNRLKDYLVTGYAINEKRLEEKQQEVKYLKTGIQILNRAIENELNKTNNKMFSLFSKGLELLDDYMEMINEMYSNFESDVFAKPKDKSFKSSINQIKQTFSGKELYPSLEEKAANLLYFITKNHSFTNALQQLVFYSSWSKTIA